MGTGRRWVDMLAAMLSWDLGQFSIGGCYGRVRPALSSSQASGLTV